MSLKTGTGELYDIYLRHAAVTTDSRTVPHGSLFFALKGDSFDGNLFAAEALRKGASCAVVDDERVIPDTAGKDRYLLVGDVLESLQELAAFHRKELGIPVIAITGTNGKTTTKELTAAVLSRKYKVHSTPGNLNNHIGVPLTLLSMPPGTEIAVVEMGASGPGEIAALCAMAAPGYGIITNIGIAHLDGFGGPEGVRKAKGELYDYLAAHEGRAFVNTGDSVLTGMASERKGMGTITYDNSAALGLKSNLTGDYNTYNIVAAVAAGRYFGVPDTDISSAVAEYTPLTDRSRKIYTGRNVVIADCYNANPSSMMAAIGNFAREKADLTEEGEPMRKALILGDMLELGSWTESEHDRVLEAALDSGVSAVYLVGNHFGEACSRASGLSRGDTEIFTAPDAEKLAARFAEDAPDRSFILIKGSRGTALEKVIPLL